MGSTFFDNLLRQQVKDICQFSKSSNLDLLQEWSLAHGGFSCVILGFCFCYYCIFVVAVALTHTLNETPVECLFKLNGFPIAARFFVI